MFSFLKGLLGAYFDFSKQSQRTDCAKVPPRSPSTAGETTITPCPQESEHYKVSLPIPIHTAPKLACHPLPQYGADPPMRRTQVLEKAESECAIGSYDSSSEEDDSPQSTRPSSAASSSQDTASSIATQYNADVILAETFSPQKKKASSISSRRSSPTKAIRPLTVRVPVKKPVVPVGLAPASDSKVRHTQDSIVSPDFFDPKEETKAAEKMFRIEAQKDKVEQLLRQKKSYYSACLVVSEHTKTLPHDFRAQAKKIEQLQSEARVINDKYKEAVEEHMAANGKLLFMSRKAFQFEERSVW